MLMMIYTAVTEVVTAVMMALVDPGPVTVTAG